MELYFRLLRYTKRHWFRLFGAIVFSLGIAGLTALSAWLVQPVLDRVFINREGGLLLLLPVALIVIFFLKGVCRYGHAYLMSYVGERAVFDIRNELYGHLLRMPMTYYSQTSAGKLVSRVMNDVGVMQGALSHVVKDLLQNLITVVALAGMILFQDWKLALISFVALPLGFYPMARLGKKLRKVSRKGQQEVAEVTAHLEETLAGARVVKAFGMEEKESGRFREKSHRYFRAVMKATQVSEVTSPLMETLGALGIAALIWYGGSQVMRGTLTPGAFFSFMVGVGMMYAPIKSLSRVHIALQQALAAAERVFEVMDHPSETVKDSGIRDVVDIQDRIAVRDVSFRYPESATEALRGLTLEIRRGEHVALVGKSGSGKSTLVNLLLRFYDPGAGQILIDGVDLREIRLALLRRLIGLVSQDVVLFDDTVRNNIAYGNADAKSEDVEAAARAAYAHEFIQSLSQGYETLVGDKGVRLSGGQRQRISIARTLLRNPPLLILDEATSSLDSESESLVQLAIAHLMKGRTSLVIAHRFSTVQNADRIVVLEQGCVLETGKHDELMNRDGAYRKFCDLQLLRM